MHREVRPGRFILACVLFQVISWVTDSAIFGWLASIALFAFLALAVFGKFVAPYLEPTPFVRFSEGFWPSFESLSVTIPKVLMIVMLALLAIAIVATFLLR
jgi:hypothetical protein